MEAELSVPMTKALTETKLAFAILKPLAAKLLIGLVCFSDCGYGGTFAITDEGVPTAVIQIPEQASHVESKAAHDLQVYVRRISGAELTITDGPVPSDQPAILIGAVDEAMELAGKWLTEEQLGGDGFIVRTYSTTADMARSGILNRLVLLGRQTDVLGYQQHGTATRTAEFGVATRYAVFALLEEMGCRFYASHEDGESIPAQKTLTLHDMAVFSKPDFRYRRLWRSYFMMGGEPYDGWQADRESYASWCIKNRLGGKEIHVAHNFNHVIPTERFDQHPEWFATLPNDKTAPDHYRQLCLSNPEVTQMFVDAACKRFKGKSPGGSFSLSPADTDASMWCQCGDCRAMDGEGGIAQRLVAFANAVATEVDAVYPGNYFPFHVEYGQAGKPVKDDGGILITCHPSLVPNFVNVYCPFHAPCDPKCPRSGDLRWAMAAWDRVSSQMAIRDYHMWALFLPHANTWAIGPRIRFFRDSKAKWYMSEVIGRSPDCDLALYITARMLWDADQDPDALIEEFFTRYFKEVANEMKTYYRVLNGICSNGHAFGAVKWGELYDKEAISELTHSLAPAIERANDLTTKRRVHREKLALDVYSAMVDVWISYDKLRNEETSTREVALELQSAIETMDGILQQLDNKQIVAEHCGWWRMLKEGADRAIMEVR